MTHHHDHGDDSGENGHSHVHGTDEGSSRKLAVVAVINVVGFLAELGGAIAFGSVALLGDAVHMLFDAIAYVMAFAAARFAEEYGADGRWSYGLHRLEPLSAFLNGALLIPMVAYILWESYHRLTAPVEIGVVPTLAIATGGLVVNIVSVVVLEGGEMSLNERGAYYHLLGDAGGSIAVILAVAGVHFLGVPWIDPAAAALIAGFVAWSAAKLVGGSGAIFLHRSPVDLGEVEDEMRAVDGVAGVDDCHIWQVCSEITVATAHIELADGVQTLADTEHVLRDVHDVLGSHGVDHATVEVCPEFESRETHLAAHDH